MKIVSKINDVPFNHVQLKSMFFLNVVKIHWLDQVIILVSTFEYEDRYCKS